MPQFPIPNRARPGETVILSGNDTRHMGKVLRMKSGDGVNLFDPEGNLYRGTIESIQPREVKVQIREILPSQRSPFGRLHLAQALLKRDKMEFVIQKAVELGVSSLIPFTSIRTVADPKGRDKERRWRRIADEALKQCGRCDSMTIEPTISFGQLLQRQTASKRLIFWEEEGEPVRNVLCRGGSQTAPTDTTIILIGPEGGFSREEIETAKGAGYAVLSLGPRILRAETAAIVAMSLIQYELENL